MMTCIYDLYIVSKFYALLSIMHQEDGCPLNGGEDVLKLTIYSIISHMT